MRVVEFDGMGRPRDPSVTTGTVLILVQGAEVSIVRVELLAPERYGPALETALNSAELAAEAVTALANTFPTGLSSDRHWLVECPAAITQRARFA